MVKTGYIIKERVERHTGLLFGAIKLMAILILLVLQYFFSKYYIYFYFILIFIIFFTYNAILRCCLLCGASVLVFFYYKNEIFVLNKKAERPDFLLYKNIKPFVEPKVRKEYLQEGFVDESSVDCTLPTFSDERLKRDEKSSFINAVNDIKTANTAEDYTSKVKECFENNKKFEYGFRKLYFNFFKTPENLCINIETEFNEKFAGYINRENPIYTLIDKIFGDNDYILFVANKLQFFWMISFDDGFLYSKVDTDNSEIKFNHYQINTDDIIGYGLPIEETNLDLIRLLLCQYTRKNGINTKPLNFDSNSNLKLLPRSNMMKDLHPYLPLYLILHEYEGIITVNENNEYFMKVNYNVN
ncbi:hypothetical protein SLOPH_772 [Spraguea lophii 42_110]|uniref:Uncharacterized protein n=1 Tax=Spraguea lophii (strain 42_110) TaxID=1358809 RepID=S7WCG6_SPRLO|nr:hypothetical protein SLOPH_772 [Spraguea lophii 42_110]